MNKKYKLIKSSFIKDVLDNTNCKNVEVIIKWVKLDNGKFGYEFLPEVTFKRCEKTNPLSISTNNEGLAMNTKNQRKYIVHLHDERPVTIYADSVSISGSVLCFYNALTRVTASFKEWVYFKEADNQ